MKTIPLITSLLLCCFNADAGYPPEKITRFYDMTDMLMVPPQFTNAPRFSLSLGIAGSVPIVITDPVIARASNKGKLEQMVYDFSFLVEDYDINIFWYRDTMILKARPELHMLLSGSGGSL